MEALTLDRDLNANGVATDPGERLFYHANALYSVFGLSDAGRNFPERWLYDAYGRPILWLPGPDGTYGTADVAFTVGGSSTVQNSRLFTGREWDPEADQYYYRARYLQPNLGRFSARDLLTPQRSHPNLYLYVHNSPANLVDPSGQKTKCTVKGYRNIPALTGTLETIGDFISPPGFCFKNHFEFYGFTRLTDPIFIPLRPGGCKDFEAAAANHIDNALLKSPMGP